MSNGKTDDRPNLLPLRLWMLEQDSLRWRRPAHLGPTLVSPIQEVFRPGDPGYAMAQASGQCKSHQ